MRAQQAYDKANATAQRKAETARRAYERAQAADERERKRLYAEARSAEVDAQNERLEQKLTALQSVLAATLEVDDYLDLDTLKERAKVTPFDGGELAKEEPAPDRKMFIPEAPTGLRAIFGKEKHARAVAAGEQAYLVAVEAHAGREKDRIEKLRIARDEHHQAVRKAEEAVARRNADIDRFRSEVEQGEPQAIVSYFELVLDASVYPEGFPQRLRIAYVPESKQLVIEYELPPIEVVPEVKAYKYVKARDEINASSRPLPQIRTVYAELLSQVTLRTLHEVFEADRFGHVETVVFNGLVDTVDKATGQPVRPCLVTVRTSRDIFTSLDLAKVDAAACLRHLHASVSKSPAELAPVKPVLEFDMVDPRFVEATDVLSDLDQRPNLMELTPGEFESLITNLFTSMGLESRQTQASRDGGVDCVAYDARPIFGGKVVIQAKRYRGTVGVSAVRDLFGTLQNEGASKGILVTTSGYGAASFDFANGKPLELIDGANLLYLLSEHAGIEAKIQAPTGWKDPRREM